MASAPADGGDEDVAVVDVGQLMADHAAQLGLVEQFGQSVRDADRSSAGASAGRERVRLHRRRDVQARHRLAGLRGELADDAVEGGLFDLADRSGSHGRQGDAVGEEVGDTVAHQGENERELRAGAATQPRAHRDNQRRQPAEQNGGAQTVMVQGSPFVVRVHTSNDDDPVLRSPLCSAEGGARLVHSPVLVGAGIFHPEGDKVVRSRTSWGAIEKRTAAATARPMAMASHVPVARRGTGVVAGAKRRAVQMA